MAIVENATVAFSQAMSAFDFRPGDRIVTTRADYPSNQLTYLSLARRAGVETVRADDLRSEEHTSELQSHSELVCRLLLEKKKNDLTKRKKSLPVVIAFERATGRTRE